MRKRITPSTERIELVETKVIEYNEGYRVYVNNGRTPKKVHNTEEEALEEAIRLSKETNKNTFVVKFLRQIKLKKLE